MTNRYIRILLTIVTLFCVSLCLNAQTPSAQTPSKTVQERLGYPASARLLVLHADDLGIQIDRAMARGIHLSHLDTPMAALFETPALYKMYQGRGHRYDLPILETFAGSHASQDTPPPADEVLVQKVIAIDPGIAAKD